MKALHFGAGNIGRGFIGKLLVDSGVSLVFADINKHIINLINNYNKYGVKIVDDGVNYIEEVNNITCIDSTDENAILPLINKVDLITTSVGPNVLKSISSMLAKALQKRLASGNHQFLNIIACENMIRGTSFLKEQVFAHLNSEMQEQIKKYVGFVDCAVDRIVPPLQPDKNDPLIVTVEEFSEWIVDRSQFKGELPNIKGMTFTDNLIAFVERKLFTLNTGHAVIAYYGKLKGYQFVKESIDDIDVKSFAQSVMQESGAVLIQRYGFNPDTHAAYIEKGLKRFANPYLADALDRIGREPLRKLSYNDRLVKPLRGTLEYGLPNDNLVRAIAITLKYRNETDSQSIELTRSLSTHGTEETIRKYTELQDDTIISRIVRAYEYT